MLNENLVLEYVKVNMGFPFHTIEVSDEMLMSNIKKFTLREFSYYIPELRKMSINLALESNKVPGRSNEFYLAEPDGKEILNVKNLYMDSGNLFAMGHPMFGAGLMASGVGFGQDMAIRNFAMQVESSMTMKKFSRFDYTMEFTHPNILRISPSPMDNGQNNVTVEYERMQSDDFSGIPNDISMFFMEFALADMMILVGRIRKKYADGNLKTPFGEIPISAEILEEGKEKKKELLEQLKTTLIPNVRVSFG